MNRMSWFWLVALLSVLLVACGGAADKPAGPEASYPAPKTAQEGEAQPYPAPQIPSITPSAEQLLPYPGPVDQASLLADWNQVQSALLAGEVVEVYVAANQHVTLVLKDGRVLLSVEPTQGEIARLVESCADACSEIKVTQP